MATPSSTLAWKIPWREGPGKLHSEGSLSQTRLSGFTFIFHFHALEKEMATHSSALDWRIPGTGEPDGLPSMGSCRVRHDWRDLAAAAASGYTKLLLFLQEIFSPICDSARLAFLMKYSVYILNCGVREDSWESLIISTLRSNIFVFQSSKGNASLLCRFLQSCQSIIQYQWLHYDLVLEKTLESPLDSKEIQSVRDLKELSHEYSLEGLMRKLKV